MNWLSGTLYLSPSRSRPRAQAQSAEPPAGRAPGEISLNNVLKLVPAEVIAPFTIVAAQYGGHGGAEKNSLLIWFGVLLIVCLGVRADASRPANGTGSWFAQVNWRLVIVSGVAFVIWAHAVSVAPPLLDFLNQTNAGFAAMVFAAIAPRLVPERVLGN